MSALKVVSIIFLSIFCFLIITSSTQAIELSKDNFNYFINGQTTIEGALGHTIFCGIAGKSPLNKDGCLGYDSQTKSPIVLKELPNGGAIGALGSSMAALYNNPPTSSTYYLANFGSTIGLFQPAYAQVPGSGGSVIAPIFKLWEVIRNLVYFIFIVIFLVVGFMIMFRQKISQQVVISAQQALPSLVIGLILVTFSYFIASLIIDLSFVGMQLVARIFILSGTINSFAPITNGQLDQNRLTELATHINGLSFLASSGFDGDRIRLLYSGVSQQFSQFFGGGASGGIWATVIGAIIGFVVGGLSTGLIGGLFLAGAGAGGPWAVFPTLITIVLLVALFIQSFRLFFALLGTYIQILVFSLAGPLYILAGSIPGRGNTISGWLRSLVANVLVFPAVFAAFLFAGVLLGDPTGWTDTAMPMFGGMSGDFIRILLAYGILLASPSIPDTVRGALGIKPQQGGIVGAAMGGFMAGVQGSQQVFGMGSAATRIGWRNGIFNRPLDFARGVLPHGLGRRIPPSIPQP